jgi:hypothetical protein
LKSYFDSSKISIHYNSHDVITLHSKKEFSISKKQKDKANRSNEISFLSKEKRAFYEFSKLSEMRWKLEKKLNRKSFLNAQGRSQD